MKKLTVKELNPANGHLFDGVLPGDKLYAGGLSFTRPGEVSHADDNPEGTHIHDDCELFMVVQGKAVVWVDDIKEPLKTGDIILVEPGENHHVISDREEPAVILWCHAGTKSV